jgi:hypothetical protein
VTSSRSSDYCRGLFEQLNILPLQAQCMFSFVLFVIKKRDLYTSNFEIHSINTRRGKPTDLHSPILKLTQLQKGAS